MTNLGEIPPAKIASYTPLVFSKSEEDAVAKEIIYRAAADLGFLLSTMITRSALSDCDIHLWGGIFKNKHAEAFIQKIREKIPEAYRNFRMINQSQNNLAILFAIQKFVLIDEQRYHPNSKFFKKMMHSL